MIRISSKSTKYGKFETPGATGEEIYKNLELNGEKAESSNEKRRCGGGDYNDINKGGVSTQYGESYIRPTSVNMGGCRIYYTTRLDCMMARSNKSNVFCTRETPTCDNEVGFSNYDIPLSMGGIGNTIIGCGNAVTLEVD